MLTCALLDQIASEMNTVENTLRHALYDMTVQDSLAVTRTFLKLREARAELDLLRIVITPK